MAAGRCTVAIGDPEVQEEQPEKRLIPKTGGLAMMTSRRRKNASIWCIRWRGWRSLTDNEKDRGLFSYSVRGKGITLMASNYQEDTTYKQ